MHELRTENPRIPVSAIEPVFCFADTPYCVVEVTVPSKHHKCGVCPPFMQHGIGDVGLRWEVVFFWYIVGLAWFASELRLEVR